MRASDASESRSTGPRRYSDPVPPGDSTPRHAHEFRGQQAAVDSHFGALDELETLASAHRFFEWIVQEFGTAIGQRVVEVGAGLGTVSRTISRLHPGSEVLALEPAANVFPRLVERLADDAQVTARHCTSSEFLESGTDLPAGAGHRFDTVVYVNVLEHIEDDVAELRVGARLLERGGKLCVFVPAMPSLYSRIDAKSGHYRRYTKRTLRHALERAGFVVDRIDYFDVVSALPYWIVYRLLRVENLGSGSNTLFDRVLVPLSRAIQKVLRHPPFGKNLIATAHLPHPTAF